MLKSAMATRDKVLFASILLFISVLFFPTLQVLNAIAVAQLVVVSLWHTPFKQKLQLIKQRPYLFWMVGFFLLILVSVALSIHSKPAYRYLDPRLALLYFPLSIGLVEIEKELRDKILLGIAIIISFFAIACLSYGIYRAITLHNSAFLYNDSLTEPVTGHQSIYISLLVNIAIYIFAYFLFFKSNRNKSLFVFLILLLFLISFLLASRNLMVVLYLSTIGFAFYYVFKKKKYLEGATLIMGLVIGGFMIFKFFPKTINRFKELTYTQFNYQRDGLESHYDMALSADQWNGANTRIAIWQCGWQLFKQYPFFGVHLGDKKVRLQEVYREKNFEFALRTQKNLHSNYLDILVSMGVIGLLIFLISWIFLPIRAAWKIKDGLAVLIMLTFAFAMVTEIYFDRSLGAMLFAFFIPFLLTSKLTKN